MKEDKREDIKAYKQLEMLVNKLEGMIVAHSMLRSDISFIRYKIDRLQDKFDEHIFDNRIGVGFVIILLIVNLFI